MVKTADNGRMGVGGGEGREKPLEGEKVGGRKGDPSKGGGLKYL